jgi:hypothetical protein
MDTESGQLHAAPEEEVRHRTQMFGPLPLPPTHIVRAPLAIQNSKYLSRRSRRSPFRSQVSGPQPLHTPL